MKKRRKPGRPSAASLAAQLLGHIGGPKGSKARAAALSPESRSAIGQLAAAARSQALSPERRRAIARAAAAARWNKEQHA